MGKSTTVRAVLNAYRRRIKAKGEYTNKFTRSHLRATLIRFDAAYGDLPAASVTPQTLDEFIVANDWTHPRMRRQHEAPIKAAFRFARAIGLTTAEPFPFVPGCHKTQPPAKAPPKCANPAATPTTIGEVFALYLHHTRNEKSAGTYKLHEQMLARANDAIGQLKIAEAKPFHLKFWIDANPAWSVWTKRRAASSVKAACNWALSLELIEKFPFGRITFPRGGRRTPMTDDEYQAFLRNTPPHVRRVIVTAAYTGARPGELYKATWEHVDWANNCIVLMEHKTAAKTGKPRRIVLHHVVVKLLRWIQRQSHNGQYIFTNSWHRRWNNQNMAHYIKVAREAGCLRAETFVYGLRHRFCTTLIRQNISLPTVAALAGHSQISTTMIYTHVCADTKHLQAALESAFGKGGAK